MKSLLLKSLFKTEESIAYCIISKYEYAHDAIIDIDKIIKEAISSLDSDYKEIKEGVFVHVSAKIAKSAELFAPCIIDKDAEIRHGAYIRGNAIVGKGCVLGNSCELKSAILFDMAAVPHFNYVGNSIIGYKAHLGCGVIISNLKSDKSNVKIDTGSKKIDTCVRKFGALVGDYAEIGCGTVLNPGTVVMPHATIYPLSSVRGIVPENSIYKNGGYIVAKRS